MPRTCTICSHPDRAKIDAALASGSEPFRTLSRNYGISRPALARHKANHLTHQIERLNDRQRADFLDEYLAWQRELREKAMRILAKAEALIDKGSASALRGAASCIREVRNLHNDVARGLGAIGQDRQEDARVNVGRAVIIAPPQLPPGSPCILDKEYWIKRGFTGPPVPGSQDVKPAAELRSMPLPEELEAEVVGDD